MNREGVTTLPGTEKLFRRMYRKHAGQLCAYLTRSLRGDFAQAEGIVQEAFLKAWEKRATLRREESFKAWIYTIAINVLRQRKRRLRPVLGVEEDRVTCERPSPERHVMGGQGLEQLRRALDRLNDDQRNAIMLVRMEGLKFREAGQVLGVSENTVKTWVRRGLQTMIHELGGADGDFFS